MAADIQQLIVQGDEALESSDLEAAEKHYAAALAEAILAPDVDSNDMVLRALVKLAGRFIKQGVRNRPQSLYRHLGVMPILERTRVMEWLARHHRQRGDLNEAEKIYLEIFDIKANGLGFTHEETTAALQTAALILQMQGKSPESLYLRALSGAKSGAPPPPVASARTVETSKVQPSSSSQVVEISLSPVQAKSVTAPIESVPLPVQPAVRVPDVVAPEPSVAAGKDKQGPSRSPLNPAIPGVSKPSIRKVDTFSLASQPAPEASPPPTPGPLAPPSIRPAGAAKGSGKVVPQAAAKNASIPSFSESVLPEGDVPPSPIGEVAAEAQTSALSGGAHSIPVKAEAPDPSGLNATGKLESPEPIALKNEPVESFKSVVPKDESIKELTVVDETKSVSQKSNGTAVSGEGSDPLARAKAKLARMTGEHTFVANQLPPWTTKVETPKEAEALTQMEPLLEAVRGETIEQADVKAPEPIHDLEPHSQPESQQSGEISPLVEAAQSAAEETGAQLKDPLAGLYLIDLVLAGTAVESAANTASETEPAIAPEDMAEDDSRDGEIVDEAEVEVEPKLEHELPNDSDLESEVHESASAYREVDLSPSIQIETLSSSEISGKQVDYPQNWHEVAQTWRACGDILSDRVHESLKVKPLDKNTRAVLEKLRTRLPSFVGALEKVTADKLLVNTKRSSISDRLDWMIAEDLADLYKQWQSMKKRPYELSLIYALLVRVEFLGPCHEDSLTTLHRLGYLYATDEYGYRNSQGAENILRLSLLLHETIFGDNERRTVHNLISLANVYSENGAPSAAEPLFRRALDASTRSAALTQEELVDLLRHFATCSEQRGEFGLAAELYEKMRTVFEAISLDSSELFETIHNLVVCYDRSGNQEKAKQYHQRLQWEIDWLEGPNSMAMREWCAIRYEQYGQFERAEQMNNDIICKTQPGDRLARDAVQALVRIYEQMGRHRDAEKLRNPWYDPDKDRPPPKDVKNPIDAIHCAAQAVRGGNLAEAKEYYQAALSTSDSGTSISLQIVDGLRDLGAAHWRNSQLNTALDIYRLAAQTAQRLLGSASVDTAACLHEAGILEDAIGEPGNHSGEYFKQSFEIRMRLLGPDNLDTAESAYEYARHYKGDRECKESALKLAIAGRERHTGLCDDRTKAYVDELVRLYAEDGHFSGVAGISGPRFEFADDPLLPPAPRVSRRYPAPRNPGAQAPITAGSDQISTLAAYLDERKFAAGVEAQETINAVMKIIDLYEETDESPELWTDVPAVSHLFCGLTLQLVAHHFMSSGDYARASATFDTVLRIREEVMGRSHPDAAMSLCDLAALATRTREYRDAERLYTRAAEIFESRLGESNLYTAAAYHNLAVVLHKRKRKQQAAPLYRKVLELLDRSGSTEGSRKLVCIRNLESLGLRASEIDD